MPRYSTWKRPAWSISSFLFGSLIFSAIGTPAHAAVRESTVKYQDGDQTLQGFLAWDDANDAPRPGVLVVHEWWGLNDYAKGRARQLAALGYVAFAADIYGDGKSTKDPKESGKWAGEMMGNPAKLRARAVAGLAQLKAQKQCDGKRVAAIGYCFGGATVLQLAYSGAELNGVVSFHGSLPVPTADEAKAIKCSVLVCHGAADPFVKEATAQQWREAIATSSHDWQMIYYSGAVHAFTNPEADGSFNPGAKYQALADHRSWADMRQFFDEIFAVKK
ncbi:MAG: dienelactone hydrolase family protein [Planctomycetia bacterium]|nr:dienelactone hydrolase family protein [Planctomycetia bacterium]